MKSCEAKRAKGPDNDWKKRRRDRYIDTVFKSVDEQSVRDKFVVPLEGKPFHYKAGWYGVVERENYDNQSWKK